MTEYRPNGMRGGQQGEAEVQPAGLYRRWLPLVFQWTVSSGVIGALAYLAVLGVAGSETPDMADWVRNVLPWVGAAAGLVAGFWQMRLLRPYLSFGWDWVAATAAGWGIGLPLVVGVSAWVAGAAIFDDAAGLALTAYMAGAGAAGLAAAVPQWMLLGSRLARAGWWLLASAVGWMMAWLTTLAAAWMFQRAAHLPVTLAEWQLGMVLGSVAGLLVGFETGVAFLGLFAQQAWDERRAAFLARRLDQTNSD